MPHRILRALVLAFWIAPGAVLAVSPAKPEPTPAAKADYSDVTTPAGWALARLKSGDVNKSIADLADFNPACGKAKPADKKSWPPGLCDIDPAFIVDLLTNPRFKDSPLRYGVRLRHAHVTGDIELDDTDIPRALWLDASRIDGELSLLDARLHHLLRLNGSYLRRDLTAERLVTDSTITLRDKTIIAGGADFTGALIHGDLNLNTSTVEGDLSGGQTRVDGDVFLDDVEKGGTSYIGGDISFSGASIGARMSLNNQLVDGDVNFDSLSVAKSVYIHNAVFRKTVRFVSASFGGNLELGNDWFKGDVLADSAMINGNLFARGSHFDNHIDLTEAKVMGPLDFRRSTAFQIDLTNARASDLRLDNVSWACAPPSGTKQKAPPKGQTFPLGTLTWRAFTCSKSATLEDVPTLRLHGAEIGAFQFSPEDWPPVLDLRGFSYQHLGGYDNPGTDEAKTTLNARQWSDWLRRDRIVSPQPYIELAAEMQASGQRDAAEDILFMGRERERHAAHGEMMEALQKGLNGRFFSSFLRWAGLTYLCIFTGYGIGRYTFIVLAWAALLTMIGTITLYWSPNASGLGFWWRLGASFQKVLPLVEFYNPFKTFMENPDPSETNGVRNLNRWQVAIFSVLSLGGWVLGIFLLAAIGGLTQKG